MNMKKYKGKSKKSCKENHPEKSREGDENESLGSGWLLACLDEGMGGRSTAQRRAIFAKLSGVRDQRILGQTKTRGVYTTATGARLTAIGKDKKDLEKQLGTKGSEIRKDLAGWLKSTKKAGFGRKTYDQSELHKLNREAERNKGKPKNKLASADQIASFLRAVTAASSKK